MGATPRLWRHEGNRREGKWTFPNAVGECGHDTVRSGKACEVRESVPRRPGKWRADGSRGAGVGEFDIWMVPDFAQTELKCDSGSGATPAWRGRVAPGPRGGGEWRPHPVAAPLVKAMMVMSVTATIAMMVMMVVAMAVMAAMCTMRRRRPSRSVMAWARTVACARGSTS